MEVFVIIETSIKADRRDEFLGKMLERFRPEALAFDGCLGVEIYVHAEDANRITFHEQWASRPQFEKYAAWRVETGHMKEMESYYAGRPSVLFAKALATGIALDP